MSSQNLSNVDSGSSSSTSSSSSDGSPNSQSSSMSSSQSSWKKKKPKKANSHIADQMNTQMSSSQVKNYREKAGDEKCVGQKIVLWLRYPNTNILTSIHCILESGNPNIQGVASDIDNSERKLHFVYDVSKRKALITEIFDPITHLCKHMDRVNHTRRCITKNTSLLHPGTKRQIPKPTGIVDKEKEIQSHAANILKKQEKKIENLKSVEKTVVASLKDKKHEYLSVKKEAKKELAEIQKKCNMLKEQTSSEIESLKNGYEPEIIPEKPVFVVPKVAKPKIKFV